jgi:hypothetical protein
MQTSDVYSGDDLECHRDTTVALLRLAALARAAGLNGYATVYLEDGLWQLDHWARAMNRRRRSSRVDESVRARFPS